MISAEEITGNKHDLTRVCKQVMNKSTTKRLISKPEAVCILGKLDMTKCTETIVNVSISNSAQLRKADSDLRDYNILGKYKKRKKEDESLSLRDFFHKYENDSMDKAERGCKIPHFVGVNGTPKFPVTADYAKHQLIVHKPWRSYPKSDDWIADFHSFINNPNAPLSAQMTYQRVHIRYLQGTQGYDPVAAIYDNSTNPIDMSDKELLDLVGLHKSEGEEFDDSVLQYMDKGLAYEWDRDAKVRIQCQILIKSIFCNAKRFFQPRNLFQKNIDPSEWLDQKCSERDSIPHELQLNIPKKADGTKYNIDGLFEDQLTVVLLIMDKILEWAMCGNLSQFKPLRITINGPAGTGKTVVINTIVTLIRELFNANGVVQVCAPTGTAAFNAGGETLHHFLKNKAGLKSYVPFSMSAKKKKELTSKLKNLLCLIIDERSLLDSAHLGIAEQMVSETIFNGEMSEKSWGNLPVLILVGDDYQLPGVAPGAFDVFEPPKGHKATDRGRYVFKECATVVMSLTTSKRIQEKQEADKKLLTKLRTATSLDDNEVSRLLNLHLDKIQQRHGPAAVDEIHKECIYLFYRNNPRILKNLEILVKNCSPTNPVAVCKTRSSGLHNGMAITSHFKNSKIPTSSLLSIGTKVALENKNFCPIWGLHNGAVGIVDEIVFQKGQNPNKGDLPHYVVVDFPQYVGPVWDLDNPTVSQIRQRIQAVIFVILTVPFKSMYQFQLHPIDVTETAVSELTYLWKFLMLEPFTNSRV